LEIWSKVFGDLEKTYLAIFGENVSAFWRNRSAITLEVWRNMVGAVMSISYWRSLWSSIELGDRKWGLNHNAEKVETGYGDQNFIQHKVESTYLERFKDRNV